mmetsp:Transcript_21561/g.55992  ORF Transcript_21561/g.55992 Transcript_21561/m.55992 type:complete len:208 (+) Transcript_21561:1352-1975(+)
MHHCSTVGWRQARLMAFLSPPSSPLPSLSPSLSSFRALLFFQLISADALHPFSRQRGHYQCGDEKCADEKVWTGAMMGVHVHECTTADAHVYVNVRDGEKIEPLLVHDFLVHPVFFLLFLPIFSSLSSFLSPFSFFPLFIPPRLTAVVVTALLQFGTKRGERRREEKKERVGERWAKKKKKIQIKWAGKSEQQQEMVGRRWKEMKKK